MNFKKKPLIKISGIAHIALNVNDINSSFLFYSKILPLLGLKLVHKSNKSFYFIGGKTAILIQQVEDIYKNISFNQKKIGLHHFCFRTRSKKSIDIIHMQLLKWKVKIIRGPIKGDWVPGYYYLLFEDIDGIRLEINYVPKKGVFEKNVKFNPAGDY